MKIDYDREYDHTSTLQCVRIKCLGEVFHASLNVLHFVLESAIVELYRNPAQRSRLTAVLTRRVPLLRRARPAALRGQGPQSEKAG